MINNLKLRDFKIHANIEIQLGNITMLTGQNGMGKSSIIQSLLLLRQSCNSQTGLAGVNLKGDLTDLGGANDVECHSSSDGILDIRLSNNTEELVFRFSYDVDSYETFLPIIEPIPHISDLAKFALFTNKFQYISAFRLGPQKGYERDTNIVQHQKQISKINGQCEYAIHFLAHYGNKIHCIPELLFDSNDENDLLETQVEKWMQHISPKVNIVVEPSGADFKLNYKFSREDSPMTEEMTAVNVGYGVTYVLPIILAILSATPGSLILIENPEAHIHPKAQAELMKLMMKAARAGIQIIIETHSDHIMNGALVSIVNEPEIIDIVKAYYFERDDKTHTSIPHKLEILRDGRILNPPKGFFDQIDIDMRTIMGF